jgi:hypothetical protein
MANSLWVGAVQAGLAASRPTTPQAPSDTFGFFYATDTGMLSYGVADGTAWNTMPNGAQGTPTAKTANATLTIAELLTKLITVTSATAVALTLPTGALTDAGLSSGTMAVGQSFDWTVINLGSADGAVTMTAAASGHTYVGAAVVAISTSATFRTRKTAANTFVTYRVS